jgi:hypothetical protein
MPPIPKTTFMNSKATYSNKSDLCEEQKSNDGSWLPSLDDLDYFEQESQQYLSTEVYEYGEEESEHYGKPVANHTHAVVKDQNPSLNIETNNSPDEEPDSVEFNELS